MARKFTLHGYSSSKLNIAKANNTHESGSDVKIGKWIEFMKGQIGPGGNSENEKISAGYTYFGQFLAHDITYYKHIDLQCPPKLNLHVLYGMGSRHSAYLFKFPPINKELSKMDGVKFRIWDRTKSKKRDALLRYDLPRLYNHMPIIGDTRNDENFIISQLHVKMLLFHNFCADYISKRIQLDLSRAQLFEITHNLVKLYYHLVIVQDYMPKLINESLIKGLLIGKIPFQIFTDPEPFLAKEFSDAAYRMGHSMVRNIYKLMDIKDLDRVKLFEDPSSGRIDLSGFERNYKRNIDWELFFDFPNQEPRAQKSRAIDVKIGKELYDLPFGDISEKNLVKINLDRSRNITVAGSPLLRKFIENHFNSNLADLISDSHRKMIPDNGSQIGLFTLPLWIYILLEAKFENKGGEKLGKLGERLIAEQIISILKTSTLFPSMMECYDESQFCIYQILDPKLEETIKNIDLLLPQILKNIN